MPRRLTLLTLLAIAGSLAAAGGSGATPAAASPNAPITSEGWGPLRVGMTWAQARRALPGMTRDLTMGEECYESTVRGQPGLYVMFEGGRLARVSAAEHSRVGTAAGVRVGQTEAQVRAAYGRRIVSEPHHYEEAPARYLTVWTVRNQRGVRFETNHDRRVTVIHGGGPAIQYIEGCS